MQIKTINAVITDAKKARAYIKKFEKAFGKKIDYVDTPKRRLHLNSMTDDDAIFIANEFQKMTSEAAKQRGIKKDR